MTEVFYDPAGHEWTIKLVGSKWNIVRIKRTKSADGSYKKGTPEIIFPHVASSQHPAWGTLYDIVVRLGWDRLPANKEAFLEENGEA